MQQLQTADFETKTPVKKDLPPMTADATWFPGALPRETMKSLKRLDKRLTLKWSPRLECWEVWHERNFKQYCFYRHMSHNGGFRPADRSLIMEVTQRAMWTPEGQEMLRNQMREAHYAASNSETGRDPDKVQFNIKKRQER